MRLFTGLLSTKKRVRVLVIESFTLSHGDDGVALLLHGPHTDRLFKLSQVQLQHLLQAFVASVGSGPRDIILEDSPALVTWFMRHMHGHTAGMLTERYEKIRVDHDDEVEIFIIPYFIVNLLLDVAK